MFIINDLKIIFHNIFKPSNVKNLKCYLFCKKKLKMALKIICIIHLKKIHKNIQILNK